VGADADLVVYDPSATGTRSAKAHHSRSDRSIFEGFKVKGRPSTVIVNGRVQYANGKLAVERGAGRFLKREVTRPGASAPGAGAVAAQAARAVGSV
jgi:dihydropyrimidinase